VTWPTVPILFCETRTLAQEWTYRFLAAAALARDLEAGGRRALAHLSAGRSLQPDEPTSAVVRSWARANGVPVPDRGRVSADVLAAYRAAASPQE
jgi:hypothetical protein